MTFQEIVNELLGDMTEKALAESVGCTQPTINRLKSGKTKTPVHDVAKRLEALHLMAGKKNAQAA